MQHSPLSVAHLRPVAALALVLSAAGLSRGQITGTEIPNLSDFGTLNQNNAGIFVSNNLNVAPQACAPTSVVNGLIFLENFSGTDPFRSYSPAANLLNADLADNQLASAMGTFNLNVGTVAAPVYVGGTPYGAQNYPAIGLNNNGSIPGMVNGLLNYIGAAGANPAPDIYIAGGQVSTVGAANSQIPAGFVGAVPVLPQVQQNTTPTANVLARDLNNDDAVQLGIQWGYYEEDPNPLSPTFGQVVFGNYDQDGVFVAGMLAGGHAVELDQITLNADGTGTIGLLDSDTGATTATQENGTIQLEADGYLEITYPVAVADLDDPGPNAGNQNPDEAISGAFGQGGRIVLDLAENVPDGGTTALLFGFALLGVAAMRRRPQVRARR
jgi:hypothetical protein